MSAPSSSERRSRTLDRRALAVGAVLLLAAAAVAVATLRGSGEEEGLVVRATAVTRGTLTSRVRAQGRVRARRQAHVGSEIGGRVVAVFVEEGDEVQPADPLFAIDDEQHRNAVAQLEVALRSARALLSKADLVVQDGQRGLERDERLRKRGVIPEEQLLAARMRVKLVEADIQSARAQLDRTRLDLARAKDALRKTRVRAPLAGTVVSVGLEVGQVVSSVGGVGGGSAGGLGLGMGGLAQTSSVSADIVIADLSELVAELEVDELDIIRVEVGQRVILRVQGDARNPLIGRLERAGLFGRDSGGAVVFPVVAAIAPAGGSDAGPQRSAHPEGAPHLKMLRPGMTVAAEIEVQTLEDAVLVPLAAVLEAEPGKDAADRVFVIEEEGGRKLARKRTLSLGPTERDLVSVVGGLQVGELLIEGPYRALRELQEGDPVSVQEDEETSETGLAARADPKDAK